MKTALLIIVSVIDLFIFIFIANEFSIFGTKFWGVRKENARREVFEQTQSYIEGKRQELIKLHHEWVKSDSSSKLAIESTIRTSFSNFDESLIKEPELYEFLKRIKYN